MATNNSLDQVLAQCETILAQLHASSRTTDRLARDPRGMTRLIQSVQRAGYASTVSVPGTPAQGLAVPVMRGGRVLATMTMRYIGSALTEQEAARRYLGSMQHAADGIAAASVPSSA